MKIFSKPYTAILIIVCILIAGFGVYQYGQIVAIKEAEDLKLKPIRPFLDSCERTSGTIGSSNLQPMWAQPPEYPLSKSERIEKELRESKERGWGFGDVRRYSVSCHCLEGYYYGSIEEGCIPVSEQAK